MSDTPGQPTPLSPAKSALSIFAGFVVLNVLGVAFSFMAGTLWPALFPSGEGAQPTGNGLEIWLVAETLNGAAAGLVAARLAGRAPLAHAAILAAVNGVLALTALGELRTMPGWFAIGFIATAPLGIMLGGLVASRVRARAKS